MHEGAILSQLVELSRKNMDPVPHALSFWFDCSRVRPGVLCKQAALGVQDAW